MKAKEVVKDVAIPPYFRAQVAASVLAALSANQATHDLSDQDLAVVAIERADALIQELTHAK